MRKKRLQESKEGYSLLETSERTTGDFLQKIARSISEIQPDVDNVADIVVFLEVLGYNKKDAIDNGFDDLYDMAKQIYGFVDYYNFPDANSASALSVVQPATTIGVPRPTARATRALLLAIPWIASLVVLFAFGVSLWMAYVLPIQIVTAMAVGLFLGLGISEGTMQIFTRLLYFYNEQGNTTEVKRIFKRLLLFQSFLTSLAALSLLAIAFVARIPPELFIISEITLAMITFQRVGTVVLSGLRKNSQLAATYISALVVFVCFYFFLSKLIPDTSLRYFSSLGIAFAVLSVLPVAFAVRFSKANKENTALKNNSSPLGKREDVPHFFKPPSGNIETIVSKFRVQIWENLNYGLYSTFFFVMLFGDRIVSWFVDSDLIISGIRLPLVFNTVYHTGADMALIVLFPSLIVQSVLMEPIYYEFQNLCKVYEAGNIIEMNSFLMARHRQMMLYSISSSVATATALIIMGPRLIQMVGGDAISLEVLFIAIPGNVLLSIFLANTQFLVAVLNRARLPTAIAGFCATLVVAGGLLLSRFGLPDLALVYLASAALAAAASTWCISRNRNDLALAFLAK